MQLTCEPHQREAKILQLAFEMLQWETSKGEMRCPPPSGEVW